MLEMKKFSIGSLVVVLKQNKVYTIERKNFLLLGLYYKHFRNFKVSFLSYVSLDKALQTIRNSRCNNLCRIIIIVYIDTLFLYYFKIVHCNCCFFLYTFWTITQSPLVWNSSNTHDTHSHIYLWIIIALLKIINSNFTFPSAQKSFYWQFQPKTI